MQHVTAVMFWGHGPGCGVQPAVVLGTVVSCCLRLTSNGSAKYNMSIEQVTVEKVTSDFKS